MSTTTFVLCLADSIGFIKQRDMFQTLKSYFQLLEQQSYRVSYQYKCEWWLRPAAGKAIKTKEESISLREIEGYVYNGLGVGGSTSIHTLALQGATYEL